MCSQCTLQRICLSWCLFHSVYGMQCIMPQLKNKSTVPPSFDMNFCEAFRYGTWTSHKWFCSTKPHVRQKEDLRAPHNKGLSTITRIMCVSCLSLPGAWCYLMHTAACWRNWVWFHLHAVPRKLCLFLAITSKPVLWTWWQWSSTLLLLFWPVWLWWWCNSLKVGQGDGKQRAAISKGVHELTN